MAFNRLLGWILLCVAFFDLLHHVSHRFVVPVVRGFLVQSLRGIFLQDMLSHAIDVA
jgi:hypothetical protein